MRACMHVMHVSMYAWWGPHSTVFDMSGFRQQGFYKSNRQGCDAAMKTWNSDTLFTKLEKLVHLLSPLKQAIKLCDHDITRTSKVIDAMRVIRKTVKEWNGPQAVRILIDDAVDERYEYLFFNVHAGTCEHVSCM